MMPYERITRTLQEKPANLNYSLFINDFRVRKYIRMQQIKPEKRFGNQKYSIIVLDGQFDFSSKLERKNKMGIYVETIGYLSCSYFGFYNLHKRKNRCRQTEKFKVFKLEALQLFLWDDQTQFSFKIITQKKIYFFRALKQQDFKKWIDQLDKRLDDNKHKHTLLSMEENILNNTQNLSNIIEQYVQIKSNTASSFQLNDFYYSVIRFCKDSSDVNCLKIAIMIQQWLAHQTTLKLGAIEQAIIIAIQSRNLEQHASVFHQEFADKGQEMVPIKYTIINEFNIFTGVDFTKLQALLQAIRNSSSDEQIKEVSYQAMIEIFDKINLKYYFQFQIKKKQEELVNKSQRYFRTVNKWFQPQFVQLYFKQSNDE